MVISELKKQIEQMLLDSGNEDFQFEAREIVSDCKKELKIACEWAIKKMCKYR